MSGVTAAAAVPPLWHDAGFRQRPDIRWAAQTPAQMPEPDLATLLLNRAAFGPRPGDVQAVRDMGEAMWIEQQLDFAAIDDSAISTRIYEELPTTGATAKLLLSIVERQNQPVDELRAATMYRMIFSPRLLHEVMVEFWTDHFSIYHLQDYCYALKTVDDREVIRPNALGDFKTLLTASAHSPAMLNYLNNDVSTRQMPNENYAREIMELHSLGVATDGYPYTEEDVLEVARCFTGYTWYQREGATDRGDFYFDDEMHDNGAKTVLANFIPASGGRSDALQVIDILTHHEATPKFLAFKLVRRFVTDDPVTETPELLGRVERAYIDSDGDIPAMLREILHSPEFAASFSSFGGRLSRPMDLVARTLRALDLQPAQVGNLSDGLANIVGGRGALTAMGHVPFYWATPDGYPDVKQNWTSSATMLARWNLGLAAMGAAGDGPRTRSLITNFDPVTQMPPLTKAGEIVDYWIDRVLHRPMLDADRELLVDFLTAGGTEFDTLTTTQRRRLPETVALILDSPYFQWR
jgi:uncharacterized protein (DUF1800 family)